MSKILSVIVTFSLFASCKPVEERKKNPRRAAQNAGNENSEGTPGGLCITWDSHVKSIFQNSCISCHNANGTATDYSSFSLASQALQAHLNRAVTRGDMPPAATGAKLTAAQKEQIEQWVQGGGKENSSSCGSVGNGANGGFGPSGNNPPAEGPTGNNNGTPVDPAEPADPGAVFGTQEDMDYAAELWLALRRTNLVGPESVGGKLFGGEPPHGAVREITSHKVEVKGHTGKVYVKKNYGGPDISIEKVNDDRDGWIKAVTVIFEREAGFDPDVKNTFWVKFKPSGDLHVNDTNTPLAGRIGKGGNAGCIACHAGAQGNDYYFWNDGN